MNTAAKQRFQDSPNGPLSASTVSRFKAIKDATGLSYAKLGEAVGLSGTFLFNLLNKGMNVGTQHVKRMEDALIRLEAGEDIVAPRERALKATSLAHAFHLRPDFQVTVELPIDLTQKEAERLSLFLQSIPST